MSRIAIKLVTWAGLLAMAAPMVASAQETVTYEYDAKGRVTKVIHTNGPSNGVTANYQYDAADNRSNVTVTGSPNGSGSGSEDGATVRTLGFAVVPLLGGTLIFYSR